MSMPPPPPPGPPGGFNPPPGYQPYSGVPPALPGNSGMAVAGLVLSLVGVIPCFWVFQLPGLLGIVFGAVGLGQTKDDRQRGRGMAIAGIVIGILLVLGCILFWVWLANTDNCYRDGNTFRCYSDLNP